MKIYLILLLPLLLLDSFCESVDNEYYDGRFTFPGRSLLRSHNQPRKPTKALRQIFIGRCLYFGNVLYADHEEYEPKNCTHLWEVFHNSYTGYAECLTPEENYYLFAELAYNTVKENQSAFWEGLQIFMDEFSMNGRRFTGIANTFTGYVLKDCAWCGSYKDDDTPTVRTDTGKDCTFTWKPNCAEHSFWAAVSRQYARKAIGRVALFLNASRPTVYNKQGLFTTHEFPELHWEKNSHIDIKLVLPLGVMPSETCGTGSLLELKSIIERKNITMTCTHYPMEVIHFMCIDNPEAKECRLYYDPNCLMNVAHGEEQKCTYSSTGFLLSPSTAPFFFVFCFSFINKFI